MVSYWGMSEKIGPVAFRQGEEHPFLGKEMHEQRQFSEETARIIDKEIQRFLEEASVRATSILESNRGKLDLLTETLLAEESLDSEGVAKLIGRSAHSEMLKREKAAETPEETPDDSRGQTEAAEKQTKHADSV
jgi:cell division protease FtsH